MGRFDRRVRILLLLAGSCARACSIDERSFVGGEPSEGIGGEGSTADESGAPPTGGGDSDLDRPSRESTEVNDVAGLAGGDVMTMQKNNGLIPHHLNQPGFDIARSRGNGWFAAGLAELMREIPSTHPDRVTIESGYRGMMNGLLQYQSAAGQPGAGLWNQGVDSRDPRNSVETSGSAMFAYALITGVRQGLLDVEAYGPAARAAWLGLVQQLMQAGRSRTSAIGCTCQSHTDIPQTNTRATKRTTPSNGGG